MKNLRHWLSGAFISGGAIVVGIMVLLLSTIFTTMGQPTNVSATEPTPTATATATATPVATKLTTSKYIIAMPERGNGRLNKDGVTNRGNVEKFRTQILNQAKSDPLTLFLYYQASPLGTTRPLSNESIIAEGGKVMNGNVYSKEGIRAYKEWAALWTSSATQISAVDEITFQGNNTGVSAKNTPTTSKSVTGKDKSGYDIRYTDAMSKTVKEHSALNRCTQPTGNRIPNVPPGPTDNPVPTPTPTPTPTTPTCPPGYVGTPPKCLQSKVPSQDPAPRGNAPVGGGLNQDPGPGTVPPARPAPVAPPVGSTPDPAPAPAPEPLAPPPSAPATGTSCAPGIPVC